MLWKRLQLFLHPEESFRTIQNDIGDWAQKNIQGASWRGNLQHIRNEVDELWEVLEGNDHTKTQRDRIRKELADIVVLACHAARLLEVDLVKAVNDKMVINKKRSWSRPDPATGVIHHLGVDEG